MKTNYKIFYTSSAGFIALCAILAGNHSAEAAPFDPSNSLDPAYSGQSQPYGRPAAAIGEGFESKADEDTATDGAGIEGTVTEDDQTRLVLYPSIGVGVTWDDNFYAEPTDTNSATIYRLRPAVGIRSSRGITNMGAGYSGVYSAYNIEGGSEQDSTYDHNLFADFSRNGEKMQGGATINYRRGHDLKGGIDDNVDYFDAWDQAALRGWLNFGNPAARLNFRVDALTGARVQDDLSAIDVNSTALGAMLKARVGNKTNAVLEGGIRRFDYTNSNQSADTTYARIGVTWEATAKTTGFISYGQEKYMPDNPGELIESDEPGPAFGVINESNNSTWRGSIRWEATADDSLLLASTQGVRISSGTGSHKVATRSSAAWTHIWSDRIRSNLAYATGEDVFKGTTRVDELDEYQVNLSYNFRRDMLLSGGWYYLDRASNVYERNYDRNTLILNFTWEL